MPLNRRSFSALLGIQSGKCFTDPRLKCSFLLG